MMMSTTDLKQMQKIRDMQEASSIKQQQYQLLSDPNIAATVQQNNITVNINNNYQMNHQHQHQHSHQHNYYDKKDDDDDIVHSQEQDVDEMGEDNPNNTTEKPEEKVKEEQTYQ